MAVLTFGCLVVTELLTRFFLHDNAYYQQHGWPKLVGFLVSAGLIWRLSQSEGDEVTGVHNAIKEPFLREQDTLFFIPTKYWPLILCGIGVVFYFVRVRD